jgi:hypothetical protein
VQKQAPKNEFILECWSGAQGFSEETLRFPAKEARVL